MPPLGTGADMMIAATGYAPATTHAAGAAKRPEDTVAAGHGAPVQTGPGTAPVVVFNPRSRFDSEAGVFVMEFRSASTGEIERRFPDERQLKAYRQASEHRNGGSSGPAVVI